MVVSEPPAYFGQPRYWRSFRAKLNPAKSEHLSCTAKLNRPETIAFVVLVRPLPRNDGLDFLNCLKRAEKFHDSGIRTKPLKLARISVSPFAQYQSCFCKSKFRHQPPSTLAACAA